MGADAGVPFSVYCEYPGLDDDRAGAPAMVDLRTLPDSRRLQQGSEQRRHHLHVDWLYWPLFCPWSTVSFPGGTRDRSRSRRGGCNHSGKGSLSMIETWYAIVSFMLIAY